MRVPFVVLFVAGIAASGAHAASPEEAAARALLERVLPSHADDFTFTRIPPEDGMDVFEVAGEDGHIALRGSTGVAMASALNHYLNHYCNASVSLQGSQLDLPDPLPRVRKPVRIVTPFRYRYCFNYCCFSYSMAWWDWEQWERAIDWMALHGINMPLAVTGQEATWRNVYRRLGLTDEEIGEFIVGPAYLPFGWMGCMDGWGGPLPDAWIDAHEALQKKIVARERELGMTPVLQGFTGHVPAALQRLYPGAKFEALPEWCDFPHTWFLNPQDPLFAEIGKWFIEEQTRQYGTDHLYAADTFIEMSPPSNEPAFLDAMAKAVHGGMNAADPEAVWVMQGWIFYFNRDFWQPPRVEALLTALPDDEMIVLDLHCEVQPTWNMTKAFHGKPWVWCIIQNFGGNVSLHGDLATIHERLNVALDSPGSGALSGAGIIMEGLGYNPVVHDLMSDMFWQPDIGDIDKWVRDYPARRYGARSRKARQAWELLAKGPYTKARQIRTILNLRPGLDTGAAFGHYSEQDLAEAWGLLLDCADDFRGVDAYQYDVVHVGRRVLLNRMLRAKLAVNAAYKARDLALFDAAVAEFREVVTDLDTLLATRREFLLGRWLEDAKRWATNDDERRLYEWNARNQITLWGPKDSRLHYYANKQWAGLVADYYLERWDLFFESRRANLKDGVPLGVIDYPSLEEAWTRQTEPYPAEPQGHPVDTALRLWDKYQDRLFEEIAAAE